MPTKVRWDPAKHPRGPIGRFISVQGPRRRFEPNTDDPVYFDPEVLFDSGELPRLEPHEEAAVMDYAVSPWINYNLRYGDRDPSLPAQPQGSHMGVDIVPTEGFENQGAYRDALDSAIERGQLDEDVVVHRAIASGFMTQEGADAWGSLRPGDQVWDPGYVSTSLDSRIPQEYGFGDIELSIELPAGTRFTTPGMYNEDWFAQEEILIGRNSVLEILSSEPGPNPYERKIRARLVGYLDREV